MRQNNPKPVVVQEPVRNLKSFVTSYLASDTGKKALSRGPYRSHDGRYVWRNAAMTVAFAKAVA